MNTGPVRRSARSKALLAHLDAVERIDDLRRMLANAERDRDEAYAAFLAAGGTAEAAADARSSDHD